MFHKGRHNRVLTAIVRLGIAVAIIASLARANAASILIWTLQDVTFTSGQKASGTFTIDQGLGTITDWLIQISGGNNPALTNLSFSPGGICVASLLSTSTRH
jgi:hypothetical protein